MKGSVPAQFMFGDLARTALFSLTAGAEHIIPNKRIPIAVVVSDPDFASLQLNLLDGDTPAVWRPADMIDNSATWGVRGQNAWAWFPRMLKSDGLSIKLLNTSGVNDIDNICYMYIVVP